MKHKLLNIIAIVAVAITAAFAIYMKGNCMKTELGYFPQNALENATPRVNAAIDTARARVDELAAIPDKTYMNFVRPLMDADAALNDVWLPMNHLDSVMHSDETKKIMGEILPLLAAYSTDMSQHKGVYEGYKYIKEHEYDSLDAAQKKLIDDTIRNFEISGINLPKDKQARLKEIDIEQTKLSNDFTNNLIAANKNFKIKITDEKLLGNMPESDRAAAKVNGESGAPEHSEGGWEFSLLDSFYGPFMTYVTDRNLRKQMHDARFARAPENAAIISRKLELREESAKILGYKDYASLVFEVRVAPSPDAAKKFLSHLRDLAKPMADRDRAELAARAAADNVTDFAPYDAAFYMRLVRQEQYELDESIAREYFELNATVTGMFDIIEEMFDVKFAERKVPLWHGDAKYYDVIQDGNVIAGFFTDWTTRESKMPGAWMSGFSDHYVDANGVRHLPRIYNVGNFSPAADGTSLLTLDNVRTMFHEMGHGLHGLLSKVDELGLSGTGVERDVVELPSTFLEYFWNSPVVLKRIGRHYKTGKQMPDELIEKIVRADNFMKGTDIVWRTSYALFDMEIHTRHGLKFADVQKLFDTIALPAGAITPGTTYDRPVTAFMHPFAHAYAAGYYSYLWAEQMAADAYMAFDGNPFNKELARKYRDTILAGGGAKKMDELYREFLGRDPNPESILKIYGLK